MARAVSSLPLMAHSRGGILWFTKANQSTLYLQTVRCRDLRNSNNKKNSGCKSTAQTLSERSEGQIMQQPNLDTWAPLTISQIPDKTVSLQSRESYPITLFYVTATFLMNYNLREKTKTSARFYLFTLSTLVALMWHLNTRSLFLYIYGLQYMIIISPPPPEEKQTNN